MMRSSPHNNQNSGSLSNGPSEMSTYLSRDEKYEEKQTQKQREEEHVALEAHTVKICVQKQITNSK